MPPQQPYGGLCSDKFAPPEYTSILACLLERHLKLESLSGVVKSLALTANPALRCNANHFAVASGLALVPLDLGRRSHILANSGQSHDGNEARDQRVMPTAR